MKLESVTNTETTWRGGKITSNDQKDKSSNSGKCRFKTLYDVRNYTLNFTHFISIAFKNLIQI